MGTSGGNHTHRHRCECGACHADRYLRRISGRLGARRVSSVRRVGAVCGSARSDGHGASMHKRPAIILSSLLVVQGGAFYGLGRRAEVIPLSKPLSDFPTVIGDWRMAREGAIEPEERDVLRADDYLTRQYARPGETASLFIAYFGSQRAGQTPHSPKN